MSRKSTKSMILRLDNMPDFKPITENQSLAVDAWDDGDSLILSGSAGTGKTFLAVSLALEDALDKELPEYDKVTIVRSIVPTRDIGFLPGNEDEKKQAYAAPYISILTELFQDKEAWMKLQASNNISFESTSFIRGTTFNNTIIIVDEMQNLTFHELDSVITRVGTNCKIIFCGDFHQSDFRFEDERNGLPVFLNILEQMKDFTTINFDWKDIVRSGIVRDYIMTKEMNGVR
jgi:phosphate starvation-inducible protein PhoH and related proteins|tara:strand:- start:25205 stop:25900 length:696 start_codon:yes stop_codon:yes gene_type:complete